MKKLFAFLCAMLLVFGVVQTSKATLIEIWDGNQGSAHVVFDTNTEKYWLWDLSKYNTLTFGEKMLSISELNDFDSIYYPFGSWHMAILLEMEPLWEYSGQELIDAFNPSYITDDGYQISYYAIYNSPQWDQPWHYMPYLYENIGGGSLGIHKVPLETNLSPDDITSLRYGAWVTTSNPIPIPGAVWLLGSGLIGIFGIRKKFKK